ncbi:MAG: AAA family ATPase [Bacteroidetes bacterium]|nr:AAA family ATPase [Bacteroidota bacterium]
MDSNDFSTLEAPEWMLDELTHKPALPGRSYSKIYSDTQDQLKNSILPYSDNQEKKERNLFLTPQERDAIKIPETKWLVDKLIPLGSLVLLSGQPKASGKTTFVCHAMNSIVSGTPFLGLQTTQSSVVFVSEQSWTSLRDGYVVPSGLVHQKSIFITAGHEVSHLSWSRLIDEAISQCLDVSANLLVIDTFPAFAGLEGTAENDSGPIIKALKPLQDAVSRYEITILLVHHDRKTGGNVYDASRGSGALNASVDVLFQLRRQGPNDQSGYRILSSGGRFPRIPSEIVIYFDGHSFKYIGTQSDARAESARNLVMEIINENSPEALSRERIYFLLAADGVELTPKIINKALTDLVTNGRITQLGLGKKGDPFTYRVVDANVENPSEFYSFQDLSIGKEMNSKTQPYA